jgi:hypothetical protein
MSRNQMKTGGLRFFTACLVVFLNPAYSQHDSSGKPIAIGWVQAAGEIFIYARRADLGNLYDGSCISGVMAHGRKFPKSLNGHYVRVYGRLMDVKELDDLVSRGISIGVETYCNSPKIAIITRLVESSSSN